MKVLCISSRLPEQKRPAAKDAGRQKHGEPLFPRLFSDYTSWYSFLTDRSPYQHRNSSVKGWYNGGRHPVRLPEAVPEPPCGKDLTEVPPRTRSIYLMAMNIPVFLPWKDQRSVCRSISCSDLLHNIDHFIYILLRDLFRHAEIHKTILNLNSSEYTGSG